MTQWLFALQASKQALRRAAGAMSTGTADTEMGEEVRLARVKAAACLILDEFLVGESSQDAALFVQDLALPRFHPQV